MRTLLALFLSLHALAAANPDLLTKRWPAHWISAPETSLVDYGVYHFRKTFDLPAKPESFVVHVSGDNRYILYVNGQQAAWGPARGDMFHWRYETVDIARFLHPGRNALAAVVWNEGRYAAIAQISHETGFLLQGDSDQTVNTSTTWRAIKDDAYQPAPIAPNQVTGYHALGPNETVDAKKYPWGWQLPDFDDSRWPQAVANSNGAPRDAQDEHDRRMLVPRPIPMMEETSQTFSAVRSTTGARTPLEFPMHFAPHTTTRLLLDQSHLTTAYPELTVSGGSDARISLRYAEALWLPTPPGARREKGNRDEVQGKRLLGYVDTFLTDGATRLYRPLYWRTFRYVELSVTTAGTPLTIDDLHSVYTGYPFVRRASLDGAGPEVQEMLDVGWRTARLCAHETYMDCPYYEQLQYAGDTRIQAMVSVYMTGDTRLMRNAIEQLFASRTSEGLTYSRAPSNLQQYIPPFSLWWIGMLHDYWMYAGDAPFVRQMLIGVRDVLTWFENHERPDGLLGVLPWWNYVDWVDKWPSGVPPRDTSGASVTLDLQRLLALQWAAEMEQALGNPALADQDRNRASRLSATIGTRYLTEGSQHAISLAVLAGLVKGPEAHRLMEQTLAATGLAPASIYFRYYLHAAAREAGLGDRYLDLLQPWRDMLKMGLTTWAEKDDAYSRSDCHAWGASPNIEFFRTMLGVDSAAPGFTRVRIAPHLGALTALSGTVPHPKGGVKVALKVVNGALDAQITLPPGIGGELIWHDVHRLLPPGSTSIHIAP